MSEQESYDPWDKLDPHTQETIESIIDQMGIEIHPWQRTMLATTLEDGPGTTFLTRHRQGGVALVATIRDKYLGRPGPKPEWNKQ